VNKICNSTKGIYTISEQDMQQYQRDLHN
jgi:hypothetical protein